MAKWKELVEESGFIERYKAPHTGTGIFSSVPYNIIISRRQIIKLNTDTLFILPLKKNEKVFAKYPIDLIRFEKLTEDYNK